MKHQEKKQHKIKRISFQISQQQHDIRRHIY